MKRNGFTLVELSIVLVIIGLLVGGIMAGQSLIRNAELATVTAEIDKFKKATVQFREQYQALPGDMSDATNYWGAQHATPATCATTASTSALTCNGDGNGLVNVATGAHETFRYWQHLANAGFIEGRFNGVSGNLANTLGASPDNSPRARVENNGVWWIWSWGINPAGFATGNYNNVIEVGGLNGAAGSYLEPSIGILTIEEQWNIDTKIDDGFATNGKVVTRSWPACSNATSDSDTGGTYDLLDRTTLCALLFRQQF